MESIANLQVYSTGQPAHAHEEEARGRVDQEQQVSSLPGELRQRRRCPPAHLGGSPGQARS